MSWRVRKDTRLDARVSSATRIALEKIARRNGRSVAAELRAAVELYVAVEGVRS
jgi:hypothetical protein